jgi:hypothetical protein
MTIRIEKGTVITIEILTIRIMRGTVMTIATMTGTVMTIRIVTGTVMTIESMANTRHSSTISRDLCYRLREEVLGAGQALELVEVDLLVELEHRVVDVLGGLDGGPAHLLDELDDEADLLQDHRPDLRRKVLGLPVSRNLRQAGQIDQREIQHIRRMNTKADRYRADASVLVAKAVGFVLNLLPDLIEIRPNSLACVLEIGLLGGAGGFADELEDQRTASGNARAPREEILLHKRFKDG